MFFLGLALAAPLPGLPQIPLTESGAELVLSADLPDQLIEAGVEPGWVLTAVDDLKLVDGVDAVRRSVADGPSREVRLRFTLPDTTETILVARRQPLTVVEPVETLPWPKGFDAPAAGLFQGPRGEVAVADQDSLWTLRDDTLVPLEGDGEPYVMGPLFWNLSSASWAILGATTEWGPMSWAKEQLPAIAPLGGFRDDAGDHLIRVGTDGLEVLAVRWPRGTPDLPICDPRVPETCLASGRQILAELREREGAMDEALRHLDIACEAGVYRACYEADATESPDLRVAATSCVDDAQAGACITVARARDQADGDTPSPRLLGLLDFACEVEGIGTLGQRLRKLEDVGQGCMFLSDAQDRAGAPDQALLALDRACVLGRAEACEQAQGRRDAAFAAKTVRECEDPELPIAPSCVELGRLLQTKPVASSSLDDFGAFLRGCELGSAEGCQALGDYVDRWGISNPRVAAAEASLNGSCDQGELRACMGAGFLLVRHDPRTDDYGKALLLFDRACEGRIAEACVAGATQRRIGTAKKVEAPEQLQQWSAACVLNEPNGCFGLAERQARYKESLALAFTHYTRACDLGEAAGCTELGPFVEQKHEPRWEGEQSPSTYLRRGCDNGDPEGCFLLASRTLPKTGEPTEGDYLLLEQSCEGEYGEGCARLAQVHLDRRTSFDDEIAARHLATACENGTYESCKTLGQMYVRGKGVDRDLTRAKELRQRFQLNAERKFVRIGAAVGIPLGVGGELELVIPIPVGPALSVAGQASYVPAAGSILVLLDGDDVDGAPKPTLQVFGGMARLYPNNKARGLYVGGGVHSLSAEGGIPDELRTRFGWNAVVGLRSDSRYGYVGLETGIAQYGIIHTSDFDSAHVGPPTGPIPLIVPAMTFSFGLAPI